MRDAAWMAARKSARRLMVWMIGATMPIGLSALALAYPSARVPSASDSGTILIRAIKGITTGRGKSYSGPFQPQRGNGSSCGTTDSGAR